ncbi:MAG: M48 family metallopeptidase, partial [Elusimicrobia bacterium]|nr:M48 family metallopeptidase [Elusimicrobiota bacterium]
MHASRRRISAETGDTLIRAGTRKKAAASFLAAALTWTSLPPSIYAQTGGLKTGSPKIVGRGQGVTGLSPADQLQFASNLDHLLTDLSRLSAAPSDNSMALPQASAAGPQAAVSFLARQISSPQAAPLEIAAAKAILGAILDPEQFLPQLAEDIRTVHAAQEPGLGQRIAESLTGMANGHRADGIHLESISKLRLTIPGSPRALFDGDSGITSKDISGLQPQASLNERTLGIEAPAPWPEDPRVGVFNGKLLPAREMGKAQTLAKDTVPELLQLRHTVQRDARTILQERVGGDLGDGALHRDVTRVLNRLTRAAGLAAESAQVFIGNSLLPNAFTTITPGEAEFFQRNAHISKTFRITNIFLSLGLLRAVRSEARLAAVLAHELAHNFKGHLKDFTGSHMVLGHFHELEADAEALKLVAAAGYDPEDAADVLYDLQREYARLEEEYRLLKRDKGDLAQALRRVRDIHPDNDLRRANLLDHMDEAKEAYRPGPGASDAAPAWIERRMAVERPGRMDRFHARLMNGDVTAGSVEKGLHAVENFVAQENREGGSRLTLEHYAIIEEAYRAIIAQAESSDDLRLIEVSMKRGTNSLFPSRSLKAALITRQLDLVLRTLPKNATPEDFTKA